MRLDVCFKNWCLWWGGCSKGFVGERGGQVATVSIEASTLKWWWDTITEISVRGAAAGARAAPERHPSHAHWRLRFDSANSNGAPLWLATGYIIVGHC